MNKSSKAPIGIKEEILKAYEKGILGIEERMYYLDQIYNYINNKLNNMQDVKDKLGYKISYIAETIQPFLADFEIDDIREVRRLLLFEMCKFDYEHTANWRENTFSGIYDETAVDDIIKLLTYLPDGNVFGVLYDFWKYTMSKTKSKNSWYLEFINIIGKHGILKFKPYVITDDNDKYVLVIKYNRFLVKFRSMYYQVCSEINGKGDNGTSLYRFGEIDNLHDYGELYILIMLSEILQPISQYNDNWDLIHSQDFTKFITTNTAISASDYYHVLKNRVTLEFSDEQNYITEFSVVKADKPIANVRVCPTKIQVRTKNGLNSQIMLDGIYFDNFSDLNTIYYLMIVLALNIAGIHISTFTAYTSEVKVVDKSLTLLENKVYNFNDILKINVLSMMDEFMHKTIESTNDVSHIVHRVRKDQKSNVPVNSVTDIMSSIADKISGK